MHVDVHTSDQLAIVGGPRIASGPVASRLCDLTFSLGSEAKPLYLQEPELMQQYAAAVRKVMGDLDTVLSVPFEPRPRWLPEAAVGASAHSYAARSLGRERRDGIDGPVVQALLVNADYAVKDLQYKQK